MYAQYTFASSINLSDIINSHLTSNLQLQTSVHCVRNFTNAGIHQLPVFHPSLLTSTFLNDVYNARIAEVVSRSRALQADETPVSLLVSLMHPSEEMAPTANSDIIINTSLIDMIPAKADYKDVVATFADDESAIVEPPKRTDPMQVPPLALGARDTQLPPAAPPLRRRPRNDVWPVLHRPVIADPLKPFIGVKRPPNFAPLTEEFFRVVLSTFKDALVRCTPIGSGSFINDL